VEREGDVVVYACCHERPPDGGVPSVVGGVEKTSAWWSHLWFSFVFFVSLGCEPRACKVAVLLH